jgi:hypothetical protein
MSDLLINSNLASVGKASHKSIGGNGSFWLPPKMQSVSFDSSLKQLSSSSSKTSLPASGDPSKVSTPGSINTVKSSLTNHNLPKVRDGEFFESRPEKTQGKPLSTTPSLLRPLRQDKGSVASRMIQSIPPVVNTPSAIISSSETISHLAPLPPSISCKSGNRGYAPFSSSVTNSGTRNAKFLSSDSNKDAFSPTQTDFPSLSLSEEDVFDFIKSYQGGSLSFGANKKGVVRFAFTLEDGSSVSVRLESMAENLQICFISESASALQSLQSKFASISEDLVSFPGQTFTPLFFSSYSEMDAYLINSQ